MQWLISNVASESENRATVGKRSGRQRGVLLVNLGAPSSPAVPDVRKYLREFLSDPQVVRLPTGLGLLRRPLGSLLAFWRAPKTAARYRRMWSTRGSALRGMLEDQTKSLSKVMPHGWRVAYAMRYGQPTIAEAVREFESAGVDELVVVPMYPQFCGATTGTALRELYASLRRHACQLSVTTRCNWYDDGGYIHAQARLIYDYIEARDLDPQNAHLVFSSHGLPASYVDRGDPYPRHILRTVRLVIEHLGWPANRASLAYHGRIGPSRWLEPATADVLAKRVQDGEKQLIVCPIGITTDCLDTLDQLDRECRSTVERHGAALHVCPALNTFAPFVHALKDLVLHGPRPVTSWGHSVQPLLASTTPPASDAATKSLVMVGTSLAGPLGAGLGPRLTFATASELKNIKRSQADVPPVLRAIMKRGGLAEAWLWNTCNRFELYGWVADPGDEHGLAKTIDTIKSVLVDGTEEIDNAKDFCVLVGKEAWQHLIRTAAGLNSQLPGERDVVDQLRAAHRLAQCAGTAGALSERLLQEVLALTKSLRSQTTWGAFDPDYCYAALKRVLEVGQLDVAACRTVVIGGSTTSASVLRNLIGRFDVPSKQLTLFYRGHRRGGNIKLLRKAIGNGRRVRVQSYGEPQVTRAVADADVVILGVDAGEPVLRFDRSFDGRNLAERPLTVIDFNLFGSTTGFDDKPGVTVYPAQMLEEFVTQYADELIAMPEFARAAEEAESWIQRHLTDSARGVSLERSAIGTVAGTVACAETWAAIASFGPPKASSTALGTLSEYEVEGV